MIRIERPGAVPAVLRRKGRALRDEALAEHARGGTAFSFDRAVYGHEKVKTSLRRAQHDKCCFCESKVGHVAYGDVEHFRPKAGFRIDDASPLEQPGYFWLAYEWSNLLYACELCNRRSKASYFPLEDESRRAREPSQAIADESPVFVDPAAEDPSRYLSFREEFPYAVNGNVRGETTWRRLGLDRPELAERRREALETFRALRKALRVLGKAKPALAEQLEREIRRRLEDRSEYAAMFRAEIAREPLTTSVAGATAGPSQGRASRRGRGRALRSPRR